MDALWTKMQYHSTSNNETFRFVSFFFFSLFLSLLVILFTLFCFYFVKCFKNTLTYRQFKCLKWKIQRKCIWNWIPERGFDEYYLLNCESLKSMNFPVIQVFPCHLFLLNCLYNGIFSFIKQTTLFYGNKRKKSDWTNRILFRLIESLIYFSSK